MRFSFVIPVYNRPDELEEFLESCTQLTVSDYEVVIVEDGSSEKSDIIVDRYKEQIKISYYFKENAGPSIARNYGAKWAKGDFLIFTDSDCILPPEYLQVVNEQILAETQVWGGPDAAHPSFNNLQKAISYAMTSVLTTGGIRGQKKSVEKFYARSFNMGIDRQLFYELGGFPNTRMHPGEDMVLAIEIVNREYRTQYIHDAFVYHKRRTSLKKFFKQVSNFGKVRVYITELYPETFKVIYLFPTLFVLFVLASVIGGIVYPLLAVPLALYLMGILIHSTISNKSMGVGLLSVMTSLYQFFGYANGFTRACIRKQILKNPEYRLKEENLFVPFSQ